MSNTQPEQGKELIEKLKQALWWDFVDSHIIPTTNKWHEYWKEEHIPAEFFEEMDKLITKALDRHTHTTLQSLLEEVGGKRKEYTYDETNDEHNDFEASLDYLETIGEGHEEGYNTALDDFKALITKLMKE